VTWLIDTNALSELKKRKPPGGNPSGFLMTNQRGESYQICTA